MGDDTVAPVACRRREHEGAQAKVSGKVRAAGSHRASEATMSDKTGQRDGDSSMATALR
jgi:hypothetical protein